MVTSRDLDVVDGWPAGLTVPLVENQRESLRRKRRAGQALPAPNAQRSMRIRGAFDIAHATAAFQAIVGQFEALRAAFDEASQDEDEHVVWVTPPAVSATYVEAQLVGSPTAFAEQQVRVAFDRARPPLMRVVVTRLGADDYVITFILDHLIVDATSMDIVLAQFWRAYGALRRGSEVPPPSAAKTYIEIANAEVDLLSDQEWVAKQLDEIRTETDGGSPVASLDLGPDVRGPAGYEGDSVQVVFPPGGAAQIIRLCRAAKLSMPAYVTAAIAHAISQVLGVPRVPVYLPLVNRGDETEASVGWLANLTVLFLTPGGATSLLETGCAYMKSVFDRLDGPQIPFPAAIRALDPDAADLPLARPGVFVGVERSSGKFAVPPASLVGGAFEPYRLSPQPSFCEGLDWFATYGSRGDFALELVYRRGWFDDSIVDRLRERASEILATGEL